VELRGLEPLTPCMPSATSVTSLSADIQEQLAFLGSGPSASAAVHQHSQPMAPRMAPCGRRRSCRANAATFFEHVNRSSE
jgi:hypothetical protein